MRKKVVGIVLSHAHLDHIGAVPKLAEKYNCPIIGTPYTIALLKDILKDNEKKNLIKNLVVLNPSEVTDLSKVFSVGFVEITHSIPQSSLVAVYTPEGVVTVAYDYKLDNTPVLNEKVDYKNLNRLGKEGVKLLVTETVHVRDRARCPSEKVAQMMIQDAISKAYYESSMVIIAPFSSQIARIHSIIKANHREREVIFLGRSMKTYVETARKLGLIDLQGAKIYSRKKEIANILKLVEKAPSKYLIISTGNQGEYNSVLTRIARKEYSFRFNKEDQVIFSSKVIPTPINKANRYEIEQRLKAQGVRILRDVHVSGHAMREDHRDLLRILRPDSVIPCHGETERLASYASLAEEEGYVIGETVHILTNGRYLNL